ADVRAGTRAQASVSTGAPGALRARSWISRTVDAMARRAEIRPGRPMTGGRAAMRVRKNPMTPLAAVVTGLLAGAAGTVCLDAVHYLKYRRAGGTDSPLAWEFAP